MPVLRELVADELSTPVDPRVTALADAIAAKHGAASRAVLFYGSCLRERDLAGRMLDFYLIVSDYRSAYDKRWLAFANHHIPPNVFYFEHLGLASKYAVMSETDFAHECSTFAWTVSTAARFAQPSRLVWSANEAAAARVIEMVGNAVLTLLGWTLPVSGRDNLLRIWKTAFKLTFAAELRAEREGRTDAIVDADSPRYERFASASLRRIGATARTRGQALEWWKSKQRKGKLYSLARLAKASLTFAGAADYIAWKINRHAGTNLELKPWQQRHPLIAGLILLPRLLKSGAVR
jgi:hypothetical protein